MKLPHIYPITDRSISGLSHTEQVKQLIAGGAQLIQLREKQCSPAEFFDDALAAIEFAHEHDVRIIINDRVDLAVALRADGVHLGQDDLPPREARRLLGPDAVIGFSTHNIGQAREAAAMPVDYVAFGPIFPTRTKQDPDPVVGLDILPQIRDVVSPLPLVAIGGIDADNVASVIAAGAESAAVIRVVLVGNIERNLTDLQNSVVNL